MTEKRKYEKPSQRVIELRHRAMLLVGSVVESGSAGVQNYNWYDETEE